ncbi:MAG: hypothetical protein J3K34DRAFT_136056 [Monoraphidium minutum]|nr:MAG: hypothetical protein J3K34DRAFT_136056 [Monoraphidium minutum]
MRPHRRRAGAWPFAFFDPYRTSVCGQHPAAHTPQDALCYWLLIWMGPTAPLAVAPSGPSSASLPRPRPPCRPQRRRLGPHGRRSACCAATSCTTALVKATTPMCRLVVSAWVVAGWLGVGAGQVRRQAQSRRLYAPATSVIETTTFCGLI